MGLRPHPLCISHVLLWISLCHFRSLILLFLRQLFCGSRFFQVVLRPHLLPVSFYMGIRCSAARLFNLFCGPVLHALYLFSCKRLRYLIQLRVLALLVLTLVRVFLCATIRQIILFCLCRFRFTTNF